MTTLKVRKIGNSLGVVLPKELLTRLHIKEGDQLVMTEGADALRLAVDDNQLSQKVEAARHVMAKRFAALRELAK